MVQNTLRRRLAAVGSGRYRPECQWTAVRRRRTHRFPFTVGCSEDRRLDDVEAGLNGHPKCLPCRDREYMKHLLPELDALGPRGRPLIDSCDYCDGHHWNRPDAATCAPSA